MECKECKVLFDIKTKRQIFCNIVCRKKYHSKNKKYVGTCLNCQNKFQSKHKEQKYCSVQCSNNKTLTEKYKEMGKKGASKRYLGKNLIKNSIRICLYCEKEYNPKRSEQKYCNNICSRQHNIFLMKNGSIKMNTNNRGKAEIYFSELCIKYYGENDILCNEKFFKDKNNGLWDADIIIKSLKIAILYDGIFHHKKIKSNMNLNQIKSRDKLKRKIILENGYKYYTIIDLGKFNKKFVEEQFETFINKQKYNKVIDEMSSLTI